MVANLTCRSTRHMVQLPWAVQPVRSIDKECALHEIKKTRTKHRCGDMAVIAAFTLIGHANATCAASGPLLR
jgi:hypothetical protein